MYLDVAQMGNFFKLNSDNKLVIDNTISSLFVPVSVDRYIYTIPSTELEVIASSQISDAGAQVPLNDNDNRRINSDSLLNPSGPGVVVYTNSSNRTVTFEICST